MKKTSSESKPCFWAKTDPQQMSNEKRAPGCLGYIWDEILASYVGIISKPL